VEDINLAMPVATNKDGEIVFTESSLKIIENNPISMAEHKSEDKLNLKSSL
jgi:hypothetical protein